MPTGGKKTKRKVKKTKKGGNWLSSIGDFVKKPSNWVGYIPTPTGIPISTGDVASGLKMVGLGKGGMKHGMNYGMMPPGPYMKTGGMKRRRFTGAC